MSEWNLSQDTNKVGKMIRNMTGDVGKAFQETLKLLYMNKEGQLTIVGESCWKWHWTIAKYAVNPYAMRPYIAVIQTAFRRNINLDKVPAWKEMLRIILPEEFLTKINNHTTQVPVIAIMDDTHGTKTNDDGPRPSSGVSW